MCDGVVCSILLLPHLAKCIEHAVLGGYCALSIVIRCIETIDVYMVHVCFISVVVTLWGLWECLLCIGRCC